MIIDCIADLHGHFPTFDGGDLLIVAGDLTASDSSQQMADFYIWLDKQDYKKKIVIAGNHDNYFYGCHEKIKPSIIPFRLKNTDYLCDSGTEFMGLRIWGSPWTKSFPGMNPKCRAFVVDTEEELAEKWALIPDDTGILVTHSPPYGLLDENIWKENCGSMSLGRRIAELEPSLAVFGHIHEQGSKMICSRNGGKLVNASHVNERYEPVNKYIRVEL